MAALKGVEQPPEFHPEGDVWTHTMIMLEGLREPSVTLALGVLLHDIGKPATFRVAERIRFDGHVEKGIEIAHAMLNRLRFPNHVIEAVEALIANHMKFMEVARMRESTLKRFIRHARISRSTWRCIGSIACRVMAVSITTISCAGSSRKCRRSN